MYIKQLILHKSKRLGFNGIDTMTYTPTMIHQIILGSNGSGKSSLMAELSPLPAYGNDYFKGGYKTIHIEHRGKDYLLTNDFSTKTAGRHVFLLEGEDLNSGGTVTVQKQLVKEHFELDQDLFDLLIGTSSFREMNATQRRGWLVRMADDNMEYALGLYNQINKQYRDAQAVVKYHDGRLATEIRRVPDIEARRAELQGENTRLLALHRELTKILGGREGFTPESHLTQAKQWSDTLAQTASEVIGADYLDGNPITELTQLPLVKERLLGSLEGADKQIEALSAEHVAIKQTLEALTDQGARDLDSLVLKMTRVQEAQSAVLKDIFTYPDLKIQDEIILSTVTESIKQPFSDLIEQLPDNSTGYFVRKDWESRALTKTSLLEKIDLIAQDLKKQEHLLYHLTNTTSVECPKCQSVFIPGMTRYSLPQVEKTVNELNGSIEELSNQVNQIDEYLLEVNSYLGIYRQLQSLMDNTPALHSLWSHLRSFPLSEYHPNKYLLEFAIWEEEVLKLGTGARMGEDIAVMEDAIAQLSAGGNSESKYTQKSLAAIDARISELTIERGKTIGRIAYIENLSVKCEKMRELEGKLVSAQARFDESMIQYEEESVYVFVEEEINHLNVCLGRVSIELNQLAVTSKVIAELTQRREEAIQEQEVLAILVKQLSPSTGLIADHSLSFIKQFTDQMNSIINSIWTYDMQLLPLAISEDLTYKFPLYMSESDTETPDINKASTAQKSVIDFAFKILLITYLGLEDYPLYLDELTPSMDETHRINITNYVKEFVEEKRCSQMFMISHHIGGHNGFNSAEFLIINGANLLNKPGVFNENVEFEYG